jgi:hypothetical protein
LLEELVEKTFLFQETQVALAKHLDLPAERLDDLELDTIGIRPTQLGVNEGLDHAWIHQEGVACKSHRVQAFADRRNT